MSNSPIVRARLDNGLSVLTEQMTSLKALAEALLEKEVLDAPEIDQILMQSSSQTVPV